ncbi:MAG: hypothetical protein ACERKS_06950 [Candidatus Bathyarchaeota archaeon]
MTDEKKCGCNAHTEESKIKRPGYYGAKRPVHGEVIAEVNARGGRLELSKAWSRSILKGEIHEIMLTPTAHSPGETLPGFTAVAFFEATQGSHTVIGDKLHHNGEEVATLIGYEMNHMPNHMNIVFTANGEYPEFKLGDQIKIQ